MEKNKDINERSNLFDLKENRLMKRLFFNLIVLSLFGALMVACGKDNYDAPSSTLTGTVTYNGKAVGVRGSNASVRLQLWQEGYELLTPIDVFVSQEGTFSSQLFDGTYKLITVPGNGPWEHTADTVVVDVRGNTKIDFPVTPYFKLSDVQYTMEGEELVATFDVGRVDESRDLDDINLLVNDTYFVDLGHFTARETVTDAEEGMVTLRLNVASQLAESSSLFARVGMKINGITEAIYDSHIEKIK